MRLLLIILLAAGVGCGVGVAMAYVAVGPPNPDPIAAAPTAAPATAPRATSPSGPRAKVDAVTYDFGVMQRGSKRSHAFVVENTGERPLKLTAGETTCKCTAFEVGRSTLQPGETTTATLEWAAKSSPGLFRQSANLDTNDPANSTIVLTIEGDVVEVSGLYPQEFSLGRISVEEAHESSVVLLSFEQEDFEVEAIAPKVEGAEDVYSTEVTPLEPADFPDDKAKAGVRVTLKIAPGLPIGIIRDWVTLRTNLAGAEEIQAPVLGRVEGDLSIKGLGWSSETGVLNLGMVDNTKGSVRKLRVSAKGPLAEGVELKVAEVDPPELKATLGERRKIRDGIFHVLLTVEVPVGTRPMVRLNNGRQADGTFQFPEGTIRLSSNLPKTPEISLRVRFAVEAGGR